MRVPLHCSDPDVQVTCVCKRHASYQRQFRHTRNAMDVRVVGDFRQVLAFLLSFLFRLIDKHWANLVRTASRVQASHEDVISGWSMSHVRPVAMATAAVRSTRSAAGSGLTHVMQLTRRAQFGCCKAELSLWHAAAPCRSAITH